MMSSFTPGPWKVITEYMTESGYKCFVKSQAIVRIAIKQIKQGE